MNSVWEENENGVTNKQYWHFTAWDDPEIKELPEWISYIVYGTEQCPKTEKDHWQGYMETYGKMRENTLYKKWVNLTGVERCDLKPRYRKGNSASSIAYCKKGFQSHEEYMEFGTKGENYGLNADIIELGIPSKSCQGKRNDLHSIRDVIKKKGSMKKMIDDGDIEGYQALKTTQVLMPIYGVPRNLSEPPKVYVFYGKTGCGKTHEAKLLLGEDRYDHSANGKWWLDYDGETSILLDDFRDNQLPFAKLLTMLDKGKYIVENKNGSRQMMGDTFVITCQEHPDFWYLDSNEDINQLLGRITEIREFTVSRRQNTKYYISSERLAAREKAKKSRYNQDDSFFS